MRFQSNMTKGELDPQMYGRVDLESYYNGLAEATNTLIIPRGGMKKRPGMQYLGTAAANGRLERFAFSVDDEYLLVFSNAKMEVYKDDSLVTNINGSGNDYLTTPWTLAQVQEFDYIQSLNTIIICHEDVQTRKIVRGATDATWTITAIDFENIPQYDFNDSSSPTPTSQVQSLNFKNVNESDRYKLSVGGILTEEIVWSGTATTDQQNSTADSMLEALRAHPLLVNDSIAVAYSSATTFTITLGNGNAKTWEVITATAVQTETATFKTTTTITTEAVPRQENVWSNGDAFTVTGATQANPCVITTSATHNFVEGDVVSFASVGGMTELNGNYYRVANPTSTTFELEGVDSTGFTLYTTGGTATGNGRGWPRTATFHEGRLWFGGAKSRPNTVWGSVVGEFFNFNTGRALDDQAVIATLDTDQQNTIQSIYSNRSLQIFTTGAEFYIQESPITPSNISVLPQTNFGSKRVRPVTLNGLSYFIQRNGKALNAFQFLRELQANAAEPVSIMSPHLINSPTKLAVKRGDTASDVNYIYLVGNDGNVTVFNTVPSEGVNGFTNWTTDGNIKDVTVVSDTAYFLVERVINSATVYYVERENTFFNTDAAKRGTGLASDTLTGLSHLEAESVVVKADGTAQGNKTVSSGQVTISAAADTIEAGLEYLPVITTMPINVPTQFGDLQHKKKRVKRVALRINESNGVVVDGHTIPDRVIGQNQFDAPSPQTGLKRIYLGGWAIDKQITVTQTTPMNWEILSIGLEVQV